MASVKIRTGMPSVELSRAEFARRFRERFYDPAFGTLDADLDRIIAVAWEAYGESRKAPRTKAAGKGFRDPNYQLSVEWLETRRQIAQATRRQRSRKSPARVLIVNGSSRSDQTCPGEMSKTWRLVSIAREIVEKERGFEVEVLDLSRLTSEYGRAIYPCKACVSTAMPLCHWPCSCCPNHALGQAGDWMNEIYPKCVAAHGVMIVSPVNWYQVPSPLS